MNYSICILTGGKSSRMGTDKSQLFFKGETLLSKTLRITSNFSDDVFISGNTSNEAAPNYVDEEKDLGPLSGIRTALTHAKHDYVLVFACDMPFLTTEFVDWLSERTSNLTDEKIAFVSAEKDHYLLGFYHKSILDIVEQNLKHQRLKVSLLLEDVKHKKLIAPANLHSATANINSTKDLDTFGLMKVKIIAFGEIEEILGKKELEWITEASDINGLKAELFSAFPKMNNLSFRFAVNESLVDNAELSMNDTIALLPPFAGG